MKKGLVLEGGAMRGLFTAGIIDVMMEAGVEPDGLIGSLECLQEQPLDVTTSHANLGAPSVTTPVLHATSAIAAGSLG